MAKIPLGANKEGRDLAGRAKVPPIAGPIIVPIDQTKGMIAYARAVDIGLGVSILQMVFEWYLLTFMLWFLYNFTD